MNRRSLAAVLALMMAAPALRGAREIKPGINLFSPQQDVELGREAARQIEQQLPIVRTPPDLQNYISRLGGQLSRHSTAPEFPYSFKLVADKNINAFALPGGPVYVHTATVAAAENEAQLAGVVAHEIAHVALRHSTHQATKAFAWQIPLVLAGAAMGGSLLGQLAHLGIGFGVNSVLLKYSRDAEQDADIVGARMMAAAGYDPVEMAHFFEKIETQQRGAAPIQFLSDHPNPGNRVKHVEEEVRAMPRREYARSSPQFAQARKAAAAVPVRERGRGEEQPSRQSPGPAELPSRELREYRGSGFRFSYPANWEVFGGERGAGVTIAPRQGLQRSRDGQVHITLGAIAGYFSADSDNITAATDQFVQDLRSRNSDLAPLRGQRRRVVVDGSNGETMLLMGSSPFGNRRELSALTTATRPEGLFFLILIAPESDYNDLWPSFESMQRSVRFR